MDATLPLISAKEWPTIASVHLILLCQWAPHHSSISKDLPLLSKLYLPNEFVCIADNWLCLYTPKSYIFPTFSDRLTAKCLCDNWLWLVLLPWDFSWWCSSLGFQSSSNSGCPMVVVVVAYLIDSCYRSFAAQYLYSKLLWSIMTESLFHSCRTFHSCIEQSSPFQCLVCGELFS